MKSSLRVIALSVIIWFGLLSAANATADATPYPNSGTKNIDHYTFTATSSGQINAYFYGSTASYTNTISLIVNGKVTPETSTGVFNSRASSMGEFANLGFVNIGDVLTFQLNVLTTGDTWYSGRSLNTDRVNHVYSTLFSGDSFHNLPSGTYISFEDLNGGGDLNYNDENFVLTNVSAAVSLVPELETYIMFLAGLGLTGFIMHRRKTVKSAFSLA